MAIEESPRGAPSWAPGYRHLTQELDPIPFEFRKRPQDFRVQEVPIEEPTDVGTHIYMEVEKCHLSTLDAVRRLARALDRPEREFGFAGRKDSYAITRQWISIEHVDPAAVNALQIPDLTILRVARHSKKLRLGQLAGNRFQLRLIQVAESDRERMDQALTQLAQRGIPNYYGAQRFGRHGFTYRLGRLLVQRRPQEYLEALLSPEHTAPTAAVEELSDVFRSGNPSAQRRLSRLASQLPAELAALARQIARRPGDAASAVRALPTRTRRFHLSAFQSRIFNRVLATRLEQGLALDRVISGDVLYDHESGRTTVVPASGTIDSGQRERVAIFKQSPSGPMPGAKSMMAQGIPGELERSALAVEGLGVADFMDLPSGIAQNGARRPLRVPVTEVEVSWSPGAADLRFRLPKGAFATTLLEELRKEFRPA